MTNHLSLFTWECVSLAMSEGMHEKPEYFATKEAAYENARWGYNETKVTPLYAAPSTQEETK